MSFASVPFENASNIGEDYASLTHSRGLGNPDPTHPDYSLASARYPPSPHPFSQISSLGYYPQSPVFRPTLPPRSGTPGPLFMPDSPTYSPTDKDPLNLLKLGVLAPDVTETNSYGSTTTAVADSVEVKVDVSVVENNDRHYLINETSFDRTCRNKNYDWAPYDPSLYVKPPPVADVHNYFTVNIRHFKPGGSFYLSHFSKVLIHVMRSLVGNQFFHSSPECTVESLFPNLRSFHNGLVSAQSAVSSSSMDEKREIAHSLGATEAKSLHYTEEQVSTYLNNIEYDQLIYYFQPLEKCSTFECDGPIAFILDWRHYDTRDKCFVIEGTTYVWDGDEYTKSSITRQIRSFPGSLGLEYLSCKVLTPELEAKLTERGQLYTTLSGVHYKQYNKERVIVDRCAWNSEQTYNAEPWICHPNGNVSLTDPSRSNNKAVPKIDEKLLYLLPPETWTKFAVEDLEPVIFDENAWDHLVIDADIKVVLECLPILTPTKGLFSKTLIKGLVEVTCNANSSTKIITDVLSGKGGGLISVLHGPPGTGKTLTAEAVAEHLKRPLYMVGSFELSTNPSYLERNLKRVLNLATAWDAVLLIDEADLERNALVSVALRVLEYHRGVLFLTTNRIGSFDEAFMSRFSIGIKYPELDHTARRIIWRKFFELAGVRVEEPSDRLTIVNTWGGEASPEPQTISAEDLEFLSAKTFNGRTIKNLVRTSQALALSQNQPISFEHVKIVLRASEKFLDEFGNPSK
ncbi:hypothetical protein JAAARDRAFT_200418 [Jaapia argillacea MUCL 33604]|uniref:AAA+ ATPase domain-containing protein n=1 Tax=Jaapia argillacea MUCL 33604 TaxID=933084 RepID=A0A067P566_9AGAM|nr:hypothetical protein JAAARDRAFT_200418 [Jaapia argillacea MUCL 33604]